MTEKSSKCGATLDNISPVLASVGGSADVTDVYRVSRADVVKHGMGPETLRSDHSGRRRATYSSSTCCWDRGSCSAAGRRDQGEEMGLPLAGYLASTITNRSGALAALNILTDVTSNSKPGGVTTSACHR